MTKNKIQNFNYPFQKIAKFNERLFATHTL